MNNVNLELIKELNRHIEEMLKLPLTEVRLELIKETIAKRDALLNMKDLQ